MRRFPWLRRYWRIRLATLVALSLPILTIWHLEHRQEALVNPLPRRQQGVMMALAQALRTEPVMRSFAIVVVLLSTAPLFAQRLTVQQPVLDTFGVGTSVSVPDRGRTHLGSVGRTRAAASRSGFPPQRGAATTGTSAAGMSAGVFIHDFEAMDRALLDSAGGGVTRPRVSKSRYDDATSYVMHRRWSRVAEADAAPRATASRGEQVAARPSPVHDTARLLALGEAAERRGRPELAALHYRTAARHGSGEANRRLAALQAQELASRDK